MTGMSDVIDYIKRNNNPEEEEGSFKSESIEDSQEELQEIKINIDF